MPDEMSVCSNTILGVNASDSFDASISRVGAAEWQVGDGAGNNANGTLDLAALAASGALTSLTKVIAAGSGSTLTIGANTELMTLSTVGATTDSSANLLPANALILGVAARVTTTITTATDWALGDGTTAARFAAANATLTAGTTEVGLAHWLGSVSTGATGPTQASAAKLRITTSGTPGAGAIRVTVYYLKFVAPTA